MNLLDTIRLKCELLVQGCSVEAGTLFPENINHKRIHLYSHSNEYHESLIPDDILIGKGDAQVICRIRYQSRSPKKLFFREGEYFLYDQQRDSEFPVMLIEDAAYRNQSIGSSPLTSICSLLGNDLLGIIPSNYCFYFKNEQQCQFCEIFSTYKKEVGYDRTLKKISLIAEAVSKAFFHEHRLKHLVVTTGNIVNYDYTFQYFIDIGENLSKSEYKHRINHVLATLMPPDDHLLLQKLSKTLFNKVYFDLEVYDKNHFQTVCPGKAKYGYERVLQGLEGAKQYFGKGNVSTNLIYGIQSLDSSLNPLSYNPEVENELSLRAVNEMLDRGIVPTFTVYHFGGYNQIGKISLDIESMFKFFLEWGRLVFQSRIVNSSEEVVVFNSKSLSNTLFNDAYRYAKLKAEEVILC